MDSNDHDRPSRSHDYLFMFAANDRYFYDADAIREKSDSPFSLSAVRLAGGVMGGERPQGDNFDKKARHTEGKQTPSSRAERAALLNPSGRNKRTVWTLPPGSDPTVMPPEMVSQCVLAGTSERGCCRVCLSPWVRVVERGPGRMDRPNHSYNPSRPDGMKLRGGRLWSGSVLSESWKPTCFCNPSDGPIPCDVLDPFNDRGVVGSVARDLGRSFLGLKSDTRKADPVQEKDDDVQSDSVMSLFT